MVKCHVQFPMNGALYSFPGAVSESVHLRGGYHGTRFLDNILASDRQASLSYFKN